MNQHVNMANFVAPKSDQLNADDLIAGPMTIRVTAVSANEGSPEQPVSIFFEGDDGKPFKPCKSMRRVMIHCWGADASKYVGRAMTLYRDPKVQFGGMQVGGIRISHMTHIDAAKTMALTASKAKRAPFTVQPLADVPQSSGEAGDDLGAWAHKFIASVGKAPSLQKLEEYVTRVQDKLDALSSAIPDAHAACTTALATKRASFAPADDDDPFADPAPTDWTGFIAGIERRIAEAANLEALDQVAEDLSEQSDNLPDDAMAGLDVKVAARRRALAKAQA